MRRMQINELFKDQAKSKQDVLSYAEIALDLGQPGIAAMLYWNAVVSTKPNEKELNNLIEHVVYCVDKLGVKTLQEFFKGDHKAEFAKIKAEQTKRIHDIEVKLGADK
jgi:hypothetical protein